MSRQEKGTGLILWGLVRYSHVKDVPSGPLKLVKPQINSFWLRHVSLSVSRQPILVPAS
jgi:hypothetical protein